ncbi:MAG: metal-dependent hydrolase [Salinirussus sp.]
MFPLGHAALAYLVYVAVAPVAGWRLPARSALPALALGSQLPDLIDKPLAFVGVLDSGRSLGHSVFAAGILVAVAVWLGRRALSHGGIGTWRRRLATAGPGAFAVGYASHLAGDAWLPLVTGAVSELRFLVWPLLPAREFALDDVSPVTRLLRLYADPASHPDLEVIALAAAVFVLVRLRHRLSG